MQPGGSVLAIDAARRFGWAHGVPGETPRYGGDELCPAGSSQEHVAACAIKYFNDFFKVHRPSVLVIEEPMLFQSKTRPTTKQTLKALWGLSYAIAGVARLKGVMQMEYCTADQSRKLFLARTGNLKAEQALPLVRAKCRDLGWAPQNDDVAAALAVWVWGCEKVSPGSTVNGLPIFAGGAACRVSSQE